LSQEDMVGCIEHHHMLNMLFALTLGQAALGLGLLYTHTHTHTHTHYSLSYVILQPIHAAPVAMQ